MPCECVASMYAPRSIMAHYLNFILQKTLSPCLPPRLPERPKLPLRYPIISTKKLVDLSDAPVPPPRATPAPVSSMHFVSNITKNEDNAAVDFHTSTISFTEGKDKAKLKLTTSTNQRKLPQNNTPAPCNGSALKLSAPTVVNRLSQDHSRPVRSMPWPAASLHLYPVRGRLQEVIVLCALVIVSILFAYLMQIYV